MIPAPVVYTSDQATSVMVVSDDRPRKTFVNSGGVDHSIDAICSAGMRDAGKILALEILRFFRQSTSTDDAASPTGDGGVAIEFSKPNAGRELDVVVPGDGGVFYFSARDKNGSVKTGVLHDVQSLEFERALLDNE